MIPIASDDPATLVPPAVELATPAASSDGLLRAGTLVYTKASIITLFCWLLAGDFLFSLMEMVEPRVLPLILEKHGASNKEIAVIVTSLAAAMNCLVNPVVSYRSDRARTRWGRRIPYLAFATPFVAIFLALIPFAPEITDALLKVPVVGSLLRAAPIAPIILIFAVLVAAYQIFNMIIGSVYYYLLRDVVPLSHLGRMTSFFRVVAYGANFVLNYWLFGMAERHSRALFGGISACYAVGFLFMCWKVREGEYEHVADTVTEGRGWRRIVSNYVRECFGHPLYRWVYATRVFALSSASAAIFNVFFARDQLHLDLDTIGKLSAWPMLICLPLAIPFGILLDRWGSINTLAFTIVLMVIGNILAFALIQDARSYLIFATVVTAATLLFNIAQSVFLATMFHPDRVGQLSSANALLGALVGIALGPLCGTFFDWTGNYRYVYIWPAAFSIAAGFALWRSSYYWRLCGGPENYQPPLG